MALRDAGLARYSYVCGVYLSALCKDVAVLFPEDFPSVIECYDIFASHKPYLYDAFVV